MDDHPDDRVAADAPSATALDPKAPKAVDPATAPTTPRRWGFLSGRLGLEFTVVVLGVFGALWADARVAARSERRVETARLEALQAGIAATLDDLREFASDLRDERTLLLSVLWEGEQGEMAAASLRQAVAVGLLGGAASFHPQLDVHEDLRNSGELSLLDAEVRRTLSAMDARLRRLLEAQADLATVQQLNFDRFAVQNVDLATLLDDYIGLGLEARPPSDAEYGELVATREFRNLVVFRLDLLQNLQSAAEQLEGALLTAHEAVDHRLRGLR